MLRFLVAASLFLAAPPATTPPPEATKPDKAHEVTTGIYLNQIRELSLRDSKFVADFWVWFRWKKDAGIDPMATFEIVGGDIESRSNEVKKDLPGGEWTYATARIVASVVQTFDVKKFPQDEHRLVIPIEDGEDDSDRIVYVPDTANSRIDPQVKVPGFELVKFEPVVVTHTYETNYGDITMSADAQSTFSRFEFAMNIERPGFGYTLKLVWGMWLSALIALLALFIKPTNVDPRFGLGVGAIFAAMANQYILAAALPETASVTDADLVSMATIVVILAGVAESIFSLWLFENDRAEQSKKLDRATMYGVLIVYAIVNVFAFVM